MKILANLMEQEADSPRLESYIETAVGSCPRNFFFGPLKAILETSLPLLRVFLRKNVFQNLTDEKKILIFSKILTNDELLETFGWVGSVTEGSVIDQNFSPFFLAVNEKNKSSLLLQLLNCHKFLSLTENDQTSLKRAVSNERVLKLSSDPVVGPCDYHDLVLCANSNCSYEIFFQVFELLEEKCIDTKLIAPIVNWNRIDLFNLISQYLKNPFLDINHATDWVLDHIDHKNTFVFDFFFDLFIKKYNQKSHIVLLAFQVLVVNSNPVNLKKVLDFAVQKMSTKETHELFWLSISGNSLQFEGFILKEKKIGNLDAIKYFLLNGFLFTPLKDTALTLFHLFAKNENVEGMKVVFEVADVKYSNRQA